MLIHASYAQLDFERDCRPQRLNGAGTGVEHSCRLQRENSRCTLVFLRTRWPALQARRESRSLREMYFLFAALCTQLNFEREDRLRCLQVVRSAESTLCTQLNFEREDRLAAYGRSPRVGRSLREKY
jgi:hypothetical protein